MLKILFTGCLLGMLLVLPEMVMGQAGELDTSFFDQGRWIYQDSVANVSAISLVRRSDGGWFVTGERSDGNLMEVIVASLDLGGELVPGFGDGGVQVLALPDIPQAQLSAAMGNGTGGLWLAGYTTEFQDGWVAKIDSNGQFDSSWGAMGILRLDFGGIERVESMALTSNQHLLLGGIWGGMPGLLKLDAFGQPDSTFGDNGYVVRMEAGEGGSVALDSMGNIFLAGTAYQAGVGGSVWVEKFSEAGVQDSSFGNSGKMSLMSTEFSSRVCISVGVDQGVLLAADDNYNLGSNTRLWLTKLLPNGQPDPHFGQNGQMLALEGAEPDDLLIQPDGYILVSGLLTANSRQDLFVAKYRPDGLLDTTFAKQGYQTSGLAQSPFQNYTFGRSLALTDDHRILAAGGTYLNGQGSLLLLRLDNQLDTAQVTAIFDARGLSAPYPNPAKDWIRIPIPQGQSVAVQLWSIQGQLLHQFTSTGEKETTLQIADFPAGLYYLVVDGGDGKMVRYPILKQ